MDKPTIGALVRGAELCVQRAMDHLSAAGHLLKAAGVREEEVGVLVANAWLHARRSIPHLKELSDAFPEREKVKVTA